MGPGMFDGLWKGVAVMLLGAFALGVGCTKGCGYVRDNWTVKVGRTPSPGGK